MSNHRSAVQRLETLSLKLEKLPRIKELALEGEPGGWRVAYALLEIEESARKICDKLIPALEAVEGGNLEDALGAISDELSHLDYHVKDAGMFEWREGGERLGRA